MSENLLKAICNTFGILGSKVYSIDGPVVEKVIKYNEDEFICQVPENLHESKVIKVKGYNKESEIYYGILYVLLLDEIRVDIEFADTDKIEKLKFYKYFEKFEHKYYSNLNNIEEEILEEIKNEGSALEGLFSFLEKNDGKYDVDDITSSISKTLKQQIEAEAKQKNLIKGKKNSSLF